MYNFDVRNNLNRGKMVKSKRYQNINRNVHETLGSGRAVWHVVEERSQFRIRP